MKILRYGLVGAAAALLDFVIFAIFAKWLGFNYLMVGAIGFVLATTLNYFLSVRFVFESGVRFGMKKEISLVFVISAIGLAINQLVLFVGIGNLGFEMLMTKIFATGSVFLWNYGARSQFVFKPLEKMESALLTHQQADESPLT